MRKSEGKLRLGKCSVSSLLAANKERIFSREPREETEFGKDLGNYAEGLKDFFWCSYYFK